MKFLKRSLTSALAVVVTFFGVKKLTSSSQKFKKIGHRGAAGYCPENTFASYDRALELGADYLEIDVQLSKDREIVVIHDPLLDRTTSGKGRVMDFTLSELQNLDAGKWFSKDFEGERIPTFREVLDRYTDRIGLLIELKKPSLYPGIEDLIVKELTDRGLHLIGDDRIIIQSFDKQALKRCHQLLPEIPVGVLLNYPPNKKEIKDISQYAAYLNPKWTIVNKRLIDSIHANGMKAVSWTVRTKREAAKLKQFPLDGIATDFLDLLD